MPDYPIYKRLTRPIYKREIARAKETHLFAPDKWTIHAYTLFESDIVTAFQRRK
jgi:hypothetical protein